MFENTITPIDEFLDKLKLDDTFLAPSPEGPRTESFVSPKVSIQLRDAFQKFVIKELTETMHPIDDKMLESMVLTLSPRRVEGIWKRFVISLRNTIQEA